MNLGKLGIFSVTTPMLIASAVQAVMPKEVHTVRG